MMNPIKEIALQQLMRTHKIANLIFWRPEELVMLSGYYPLWGLSFLIYTESHPPILFVPEVEPEDILPSGIEVRTYPWGKLSENNPWDDLFGKIKMLFKTRNTYEKCLSFIVNSGGSVPCRMSAEAPHLPHNLEGSLMTLNGGVFADFSVELKGLFEIKTKPDLDGIRLAHQVVAKSIDVFYEYAAPGICEAVLASKIEYAVSSAMQNKIIGLAKAWPLIQSGINSACAGKFNRTGSRIIESGDFVLLEMAACVNGYWLDITRTVVAGQSSAQQDELMRMIKTAQMLAIQAIEPNKEMKFIDDVARSYIRDNGYGSFFNHALGHQVGFRYHDHGHGLNPFSLGVLTSGMVLTVEPGVYAQHLNGGIRIEDNILVTDSGYELLSTY